jgi:hypothetical protein
MDCGLSILGLLVMALSWLGGHWWRYGISDYIINTLRLIWDSIAEPFNFFWQGHKNLEADGGTVGGKLHNPKRSRLALSILAGLFLALPIVSLLAALLASADPIFSIRIQNLLAFFNLEKLGEYLARSIYILIVAHLLSGVYLYALLSSSKERYPATLKPALPPFLGWLEAAIVLACVDLLFAFFVTIQFQYFFGGRVNISLSGYTYAEYARRGFGELLAVAMISLLLFLILSTVTRRDPRISRLIFSILGGVLVGLVVVILVSAFQRLLLYEAAYGFSRLRAYTHVFMVWLGVLLLVTAALEWSGSLHRFTLAVVLVTLGFGFTLNLLNVDGFITNQNVARAMQGKELDEAYLASLSDDAIPALFKGFLSPKIPQLTRDQLGAVLACRLALARQDKSIQSWPSWHWSRAHALRLFSEHESDLARYRMWRQAVSERVEITQDAYPCNMINGFD